MNILAIETSCDETAVAILAAKKDSDSTVYTALGNALYSQASKHAEYGGVYPNLAKREHQKNLAHLTEAALKEAGLHRVQKNAVSAPDSLFANVREGEFRESIAAFLEAVEKPNIDFIAVTSGPGLEPALWTGIVFAEVLGRAWAIPVIPVDHMEGHIFSALLETEKINSKLQETNSKIKFKLSLFDFPLLSLLISGGHTELVAMKDWFQYELVGETRDDAIGEAFDKVARLLDLPYPGGPEVSRFAAVARERGILPLALPRPMLNSADCDFSFSGLKTAVLYALRDVPKPLAEEVRLSVALGFENAARDVVIAKTRRALERTAARTLAVGGGVAANTTIREALGALIQDEFPNTALFLPNRALTGDNAIMIGVAGHLRNQSDHVSSEPITARGSQCLA